MSISKDTKYSNKDIILINSDIEPLTSYQIKGINIGEFKYTFSNRKIIKGFHIKNDNNCLIVLENLQLKGIIFLNPITVYYEAINDDNQKIKCDENVHSTAQIDDTIKQIGATRAFFYIDNQRYSYFEQKNRILHIEN